MPTIFFIEFTEDIQCFLDRRDPGDIIIALRPEVTLELDIYKIPYKCLRTDYYTHEEYMANSSESKHQVRPVLQALDKELWRHNAQYKTFGFKPFEMFIYFFRISLDTLRNEIFELDRLFNKENVNKVKLIKHESRSSHNNPLIFYDSESVYEKLVYLMKQKYKYGIEAIDNKNDVKSDTVAVSNPAPESCALGGIYFATRIKELVRRIYGLKNRSSNKKGNILSVDCWELSCIKQELVGLGWSIHDFPTGILERIPSLSAEHNYSGLISEFEKNNELINLFEFLGVNFYGIIKSRLEYFCRNIETHFRNYNILSDYIDRNHFDIVFFGTHTPHSAQNFLLPFICRERDIPYVCWMHGGYGTNYKVAGYDLSDYTFGHYYFVYGEEVKKLLDSHYSEYSLSTKVAGSPLILKRYKDYIPPRNSKKVITLIAPPWETNCRHTDTDCPYDKFSYWVPLKAILELLIQYRDKYRVIIRSIADDPSLQTQTFRRLFEYNNAEGIEIIPIKEMAFKKIVEDTDLFISLWISTTFWEACFSHADIFLMDNSDLTDIAKAIIPKRAFLYDNLAEFTQGLRQYLDEGIFYQKSKDKSFLKSYMDFDRKDQIVEHVSQTIEDMIHKTSGNEHIN